MYTYRFDCLSGHQLLPTTLALYHTDKAPMSLYLSTQFRIRAYSLLHDSIDPLESPLSNILATAIGHSKSNLTEGAMK